jgi:hypothetical protein
MNDVIITGVVHSDAQGSEAGSETVNLEFAKVDWQCGSLISAFGIKRAIRGFDTLEAMGGFRDRPSNREIIGLAFDY